MQSSKGKKKKLDLGDVMLNLGWRSQGFWVVTVGFGFLIVIDGYEERDLGVWKDGDEEIDAKDLKIE